MVSLSTFRPEHIPALYELYATQTAGLPRCLMSSQAGFAADLTHPGVGQILVVEDEGAVSGFAALRNAALFRTTASCCWPASSVARLVRRERGMKSRSRAGRASMEDTASGPGSAASGSGSASTRRRWRLRRSAGRAHWLRSLALDGRGDPQARRGPRADAARTGPPALARLQALLARYRS